MNVLFVDNFDSFTYNLVEYVSEQTVDGERPETTVLKNTASLDEVRAADPDAIVISPGPGHPKNDRDVGVTAPVLRDVSTEVPTLGVCLGMEAAVYEYGGTVDRAPEPMHGKTSPVEHDGRGVFDGIEQGFPAARYHSLACGSIPDCFEISARTDHDGTELAMAVRHREHPIAGVQFHPESVLTAAGHDIVENFLASV
ncbi:anthranilate synthase component II [Halobacterium sp. R2-5]|uniref:anthranilate synthase component II n=1 Tax=Halobacterium sp. R2-5 TaxID=2715751 RepID=UPI0014208831|nr:anthranilate synthase component II [Halobacterium sp. R2-5]NIC00149.1 aminodeoxychorismate/anthranilate synthase component II [Halobacterium sp. R2-5]